MVYKLRHQGGNRGLGSETREKGCFLEPCLGQIVLLPSATDSGLLDMVLGRAIAKDQRG